MRHRLLVMAAALLLALVLIAGPASAAKSGQTQATAAITALGGCRFQVTYAWSGFSGTGLTAELALGYEGYGYTNVAVAWTFIPDRVGGSGSVSAIFTLTGTPIETHEYFGLGELFKPSRKAPTGLTAVRDSYVVTDYLAPETCGPDATIA